MKNMEALSLEDLEMISGGGAFDTGNMGGAAKALLDDSQVQVTQSFVWLKNKLFTDPMVNHSFVWLKNK